MKNIDQKLNVMVNYLKVKNEFDQKLNELKKEIHPSIYTSSMNELVLYQKLMELEEQIKMLKEKSVILES